MAFVKITNAGLSNIHICNHNVLFCFSKPDMHRCISLLTQLIYFPQPCVLSIVAFLYLHGCIVSQALHILYK